jgi:hypothetical protein
MEASTLNATGDETRCTPTHHFPLPPLLPDRYHPSFNGNNQYRLPDPKTGEMRSWTRATSLAHVLDDTYALNQWRIRKVLIGLERQGPLKAALSRLVDDLDSTEIDEDQARGPLNSIADNAARAADADKSSEFGTAVHDWTSWVDMGLMSVHAVPALFRAHADAGLRMQGEAQLIPIPEYTERIVMNSALGCVGTLDRIYMDARRVDLPLVLGDVKTSRTLAFSGLAFAVQLAFYQSCDLMLSLDGMTWDAMPTLRDDWAYIMHLPSDHIDEAAVQPIDLTFGREALTIARHVQALRGRSKTGGWPRTSEVLPPMPHRARWFAARRAIQMSSSAVDLAAAWSDYQDVWTDDLTAMGLALIGVLPAHGNENARHD